MTLKKGAPRPGTTAWWNERTKMDGDCILYTGFTFASGHAQISYNGKRILIHRLAYELAHGPIAPGLVIGHTCDRGNCVNPDHLFAGTQRDNLRDMFAKGRARPRGKATPALASFPAQSYVAPCRVRQSMSRKNSNQVRQVVGILHLTSNSASPADDSHLLSGTNSDSVSSKSRRSSARETWTRPDLRTAQSGGSQDAAAD